MAKTGYVDVDQFSTVATTELPPGVCPSCEGSGLSSVAVDEKNELVDLACTACGGSGKMSFADLKALAQSLPEMTEEEKETQRMDWAYGQLAASTHHKPSREAFRKLVLERGWTEERFAKFAEGKTWRP